MLTLQNHIQFSSIIVNYADSAVVRYTGLLYNSIVYDNYAVLYIQLPSIVKVYGNPIAYNSPLSYYSSLW